MITTEQLIHLANRRTPHREAFEAMGFRFLSIEVQHSVHFDSPVLRAMFECVCGKVEALQDVLDPWMLKQCPLDRLARELDIARRLIEDFGSTSPKHLREDGYTEEQIEEIQRKGREALARLQ